LVSALRSQPADGRLTVERLVIDFVATQRDHSERAGDRKRFEATVVHTLQGRLFLDEWQGVAALTAAIATVNEFMRRVAAALDAPEATTARQMGNFLKLAKGTVADVRSVTARAIAAERFLARSNLIGLTRWVNDPDNRLNERVELFLEGRQLRAVFADKDDAIVHLPPGYVAPTLQGWEEFRALVDRLDEALLRA
jgi:hypothetical protein